ncbi:MAG TPA: glycoside hydrolase family 99-like domain-containing protein [Casimicrobiaceae bacterium]|nr:glycoside hydrolase family 99-like domain-containing protein [Casimicrobiaceae bacterium]
MSDVKLIAFYLPQFHPIPENDAWWGEGFTEWINVKRARPNFVGHYQPHLPGELGFYDLRAPETRAAQVELARAHGIHGFCYYYYWFNGRRLLHRPLDDVVQSGQPDFPFCVCWANENWTRRWDGGNDELLVAQKYSPENEQALISDLVPLFRDPRYIRVRGRPLVLVYRANLLPEPRRATDIFRSVTRAAGDAEPYLVMVHVPGMSPPGEWGFDAGVEFPPHSTEVNPLTEDIEKLNPNFVGDVWDYVSAARYAIGRPLPDFPLFRGVMVGWDNTPRLQDNGHVFVNTHPENYRRWLSAMIAQTRQTKPAEERLVFINAWNEWGEGCYLEPDLQFGRGYLEATLRALQGPAA